MGTDGSKTLVRRLKVGRVWVITIDGVVITIDPRAKQFVVTAPDGQWVGLDEVTAEPQTRRKRRNRR